jgi:4-hydroxy-2-oxoglutarate aldolase
MDPARLHGILAPICTPFHEDGELHLAALRDNMGKYSRTPLAGFVVAGSTGEAAFLSREEKRLLFQAVRETSGGKLLIAGTGAESVRETLACMRDAADLQYDAALVLTPHYYRAQMLRPETQVAFFRAVADDAPIPVLLYNFPQMTSIDLPLEVVLELSKHPNIAGIKESSADLEKVAALTSGLPAGVPILTGASAKFYDCLRLGATGGILAIANVLPDAAQLIFDRYQAGDIAGSCEAQRRIVEAAGVAPRYGIAGLKYAMDRNGYYGGPVRLPLLPLDDEQKTTIDSLFRP